MKTDAIEIRSAPLLLAGLVLVLSSAACGRDKPAAPKDDGKSVMEGGKARTDPGRALEDAKQGADAAQQKLEKRNDDMFERSAGENVGRGSP